MKSGMGIGIVFSLVALVLLAVALGVWQSNERWMEQCVDVPGAYSQVGKGSTHIRYEAEGKTWEKAINFYSSDMRVGDPVTVWYPAGQPEQGRVTIWVTWGIFAILGGVFLLIGLSFLATNISKITLRNRLQREGVSVQARIVGVKPLTWMKINGRTPWVILGACTHPYTGVEMKVRSHLLLMKPQVNQETVTVLVDPMRDRRYVMLTEEIMNAE